MLEKDFLDRLFSKEHNVECKEVENVINLIEKEAESGNIESIDAFIRMYTLLVHEIGITNVRLHKINQYYIIYSQVYNCFNSQQLGMLYIRNVEYYYQINDFAACARYANMILDLSDIPERLRLTTISYLVVLLKNPILSEEEKFYSSQFNDPKNQKYLTNEFRLLVYTGLIDAVCLSKNKEEYIRLKETANSLAKLITDEDILLRYRSRIVMVDEVFSEDEDPNILDKIQKIIDSIPENLSIVDSVSETIIELCKKIKGYISKERIVSFIIPLIDLSPTSSERIMLLSYLIDDIGLSSEYKNLYERYFEELKNYRNTVQKYAALELKNELVFYKKSLEKQKQNYLDGLTGLYNRNSYEIMINESPAELDSDLAVIMGDVNFLKQINDTYGHAEGDKLLECLGHIIKEVIEPFGKAYRVGGDEFVAIVHSNDPQDIVTRLKTRVEATSSPSGKPYSISFGLAAAKNLQGLDISELINLADQRMYKEKQRIHKQKV